MYSTPLCGCLLISKINIKNNRDSLISSHCNALPSFLKSPHMMHVLTMKLERLNTNRQFLIHQSIIIDCTKKEWLVKNYMDSWLVTSTSCDSESTDTITMIWKLFLKEIVNIVVSNPFSINILLSNSLLKLRIRYKFLMMYNQTTINNGAFVLTSLKCNDMTYFTLV